jgi:hypothetical protein
VVSSPTFVPSTKNSTRTTARPDAGTTSARKLFTAPLGNVVLAGTVALVRGETVSVMAGDEASVTVTPTAGAATALPLLSVAIAVIDAMPETVGVQLIVQVDPDTVALPMDAPFTTTCTDVMLPSASETVPVIGVAGVGGVPEARPMNAPLLGDRIATSGAEPNAPEIEIGNAAEEVCTPVAPNAVALRK